MGNFFIIDLVFKVFVHLKSHPSDACVALWILL